MAIIKDYSDERSKLEEEIDRLESVGTTAKKPTLPEVKLEMKEYDAPSDEALQARAEESLNEYKAQQQAAIHAESERDAKALSDSRESYEGSLKNELAGIRSDYAAAADSIDNDVLKRGLARSSIAVNAKSALESDTAAKSAAVRAEYGKKIADIDAQIATVDSRLKKALDDFNLSYAVKLSDTLNSLKAERDKTQMEVLEYNNTIKEKQAKLEQERLKTESTLYSAAISQNKAATSLDGLSDAQRDEIYKAVYQSMDSFLSSLSPSDAQLELKNHTLYRDHLSPYYYAKLYKKYAG